VNSSLNENHGNVDQGDVVYGVRYILGLIEEGLGISNVETHFDSPQQEQEFAYK
jgi:hypothetical protein